MVIPVFTVPQISTNASLNLANMVVLVLTILETTHVDVLQVGLVAIAKQMLTNVKTKPYVDLVYA